MTLVEAVAKVKAVFGVEPVRYENNEAVYELNGVSLFTVSGSGEHTYAALRLRGRPNQVELLDATEFERDYQREWITEAKAKVQELLALANTPAVVPERVEVTVTNVDYSPGDKWSNGELDFDADTSLGEFTFRQVVPGPRSGDDSYELTVTLDGHELDLDFLEVVPPDFDPPGKPGRTADKFAESIDAEVAEELPAWLEAHKEVLARAVARAKVKG